MSEETRQEDKLVDFNLELSVTIDGEPISQTQPTLTLEALFRPKADALAKEFVESYRLLQRLLSASEMKADANGLIRPLGRNYRVTLDLSRVEEA